MTTPILGRRYWCALCLASIFGADLGDFASHDLGLGHWRGLPVLAVLFAATLWAARRGRAREAWYWIGILIVRTAATNFADLQTHDIHAPFAPLMVVYALALAALVAASRRGTGVPRANGSFWVGMLIAGTLGTVAGDDLSRAMAHGPAGSSAVMSVVLAMAFAGAPLLRALAVARFWIGVVLVRIWGTNVGDLVADHIGLDADVLASGLAFVTLLLAWPRREPVLEKTRVAAPAS